MLEIVCRIQWGLPRVFRTPGTKVAFGINFARRPVIGQSCHKGSRTIQTDRHHDQLMNIEFVRELSRIFGKQN